MSILYQGHEAAVIAMPGKQAALVTFSAWEDTTSRIEPISKSGTKGGYKIRFWGAKNNLPQFREKLVMQNNIVPALLKTKRDMLFGTGLFPFINVFKSDGGAKNIQEVPMPKEPDEFFETIGIDDYLLDQIKNLILHATIYHDVIMSNDRTKISFMKVIDCKYIRVGESNKNGDIKHAYVSGNWVGRDYNADNSDDITELPLIRMGIDKIEKENLPEHFILMTGDNFFNDGSYNSPDWFSGRTWIEVSNIIPLFHQNNINNGYTFRFHIKIPKGYFFKAPISDAVDAINNAQRDEAAARDEFLKSVNDMFAGVPGSGRAVWTQFDVNLAMGSHYPGITIEPINYDMKDKSLLDLFEKSNTANISSQGIHPVLANIETQGKLSSGSEIRNAFIMWLAIKAPIPRRIVLKSINLVKKINGWDPEINFAFGDTEITTLDESPTGKNEGAAVMPAPVDKTDE